MAECALVVGGTGPTGPGIVRGLVERGYAVTVFHTGSHESPLPAGVVHIHGDPHFAETIAEALGDREFELVVGMYGRLRHLAMVVGQRCRRFVGVGGIPIYRGYMLPSTCQPAGMRVLARETESEDTASAARLSRLSPAAGSFVGRMAATEETVFKLAADGAFDATWLRYPIIYGARQAASFEQEIIRRVLDRRQAIVLPDSGLEIHTRLAADNAVRSVLLAVDNAAAARNQCFNCGDDEQYSLRQWTELIIAAIGGQTQIVSLPADLAPTLYPTMSRGGPNHSLVDTSKIRSELGYSDAVHPVDALRSILESIPSRSSSPEDELRSASRAETYAAEDNLIAAYTQATSAMHEIAKPLRTGVSTHAYAHPHKPATKG